MYRLLKLVIKAYFRKDAQSINKQGIKNIEHYNIYMILKKWQCFGMEIIKILLINYLGYI